jgi:hypothetical protein
MAVQLPDFTALAGQPTGIENVPPGNLMPTYYGQAPEAEAEAATGAALGKLGGGLQTLGTAASRLAGQQQIQTNMANMALAQAKLFTDTSRTEAAIKASNDPAQVDQLYNQIPQHLEDAAQLIPDPGLRELWKAKHSETVIKAQLGAEGRQRTLYDQNAMAGVGTQLDELGKTYANSDDPAVRQQALTNVSTLTGWMKEAGIGNPVEIAKIERQSAQNMAIGLSERLWAQGRPKEALDNLMSNLSHLPDTARVANLANTLRHAENKGEGNDVANQAWPGSALGGGRVPIGGGGGGGGQPLVPYEPATGLLEGTGLNTVPGGYDIYRRTTASEEAPRYDTPPSANRYGYMGRYQMGGAETAQIRKSEDYNEIAKAAKRMNIPVPTTQEFLNNPQLQEQLFENYTLNNHNELMQRVPQYRDASPQEKAAMLMGAHIGGVGGVNRYLKSGGKDDPSDGHRSVGDYMRIMRGAMASGGPKVDVEPYAPTPGTAGGFGATTLAPSGEPATPGGPTTAAPGTQGATVPAATDGGPAAAPTAPAPDVTLPAVTVAAAPGAAAITPIPTGVPAVPPAAAPGLPPLPDIEQIKQGILDRYNNGEISQDAANRGISIVQGRYNHLLASQAADKATVAKYVNSARAALLDGHDVSYDPAEIRHYYPKEQADGILQELQDAKEGGLVVNGVRTASPADVDKMRAQLVAGLNEPGAPDYPKRAAIYDAFNRAVDVRSKALMGPQANPVSYLETFDPLIQQARAAIDPNNPQPQALQDFATKALSEQARLGVPSEFQRVLSNERAKAMAFDIGKNPANAPAIMQDVAQRYGPAWRNVWSDLITEGKLPAGYQVVGQLADNKDATNAAILARTLGVRKQDDPAFERVVGAKLAGGKSIRDIATETIPLDSQVQKYERSLVPSSSWDQILAIRQAIEHLAEGRAYTLNEEPPVAVKNAIDAVVGHYQFVPNGGGRVPTDRFDDVTYNNQQRLNERTVDNTTIPPRYTSGAPGEPKPQDYIDDLKARAAWITGAKADRLVLIDPGGGAALDKAGNRIETLYDEPAPGRLQMPPNPLYQIPPL